MTVSLPRLNGATNISQDFPKINQAFNLTETKLNELQNELSAIEGQSGSDNTEVVAARASNSGLNYPNLKARLEGDKNSINWANKDLNDVVNSGVYYAYSTTTNKPSSSNGNCYHHNAFTDGTFATQLFVPQSVNTPIYKREKNAGVWSDWTEFLTQNMKTNLSFSQIALGLQVKAGNVGSFIHLADFPEVTSEYVEARFFRHVNTTGGKGLTLFKGDGTPTVSFAIRDGYINMLNGFGIMVTAGTGSPEGVVTANSGSIYLNRSGGANTSLYVKETGTGNTGWRKVTTTAP